ncbi:MAG: hypothetical protein H8E82_08535 [Candidatus Marinimicrobia bacterium]|nr:hypothetical protein [Candidatus Neomarinimicrobiota bacterium]
MTHQLEIAFKKASKLPEREQNTIARWLIEEINSDAKWDKLFANSEDQLETLAKNALKNFDNDKTDKLDINKL